MINLKIRKPKIKSKINIIKLKRLFSQTKSLTVHKLTAIFIESFNFNSNKSSDRLREIIDEFNNNEKRLLKNIIYVSYYVIYYYVHKNILNCEKKKKLITKVNNFVKKNFNQKINSKFDEIDELNKMLFQCNLI